jgi:Anti-sigma-K factor rskA
VTDIKAYISSGEIEAYVMGLTTAEETAAVEQMRLQYPEVDKAIADFELLLEKKIFENSTAKLPASFKETVKAGLDMNQDKKPAIVVPMKKNNAWKYAAAVAGILFVSSAVYNFQQNNTVKALKNKVADAELKKGTDVSQFLRNRNITPVGLYGVGIHGVCRCTLLWDKQTGNGYVMVHHLIVPPADKAFEVWVKVDGKYVHAGTLNTSDYTKMIELKNIPEGSQSFYVSLEQKGNVSTPTESEIYVQGSIS